MNFLRVSFFFVFFHDEMALELISPIFICYCLLRSARKSPGFVKSKTPLFYWTNERRSSYCNFGGVEFPSFKELNLIKWL